MYITNDGQLIAAIKKCAEACLDGVVKECIEWMHNACSKFGFESIAGGIADAWESKREALMGEFYFMPSLLSLVQGNPWIGEETEHGSSYGTTSWDIRDSFMDLLCNGLMPRLFGEGNQPPKDVWSEFIKTVDENIDDTVIKYGRAAGFDISKG